MSGHDFLKIIKSNAATSHIPVVMFSSSDDQRDINQSYELGANGYVSNPRTPRNSWAQWPTWHLLAQPQSSGARGWIAKATPERRCRQAHRKARPGRAFLHA
jgi:DNA-binding NarL/FixJ family response regulator